MDLSTDYTDRTKERIKVYSQIPQIKIKREKLFSDRIYRLNKKDSTDWTKERILVYSQIPQIGQKGEYWFIHRFHILNKRKKKYLSTDCTDGTSKEKPCSYTDYTDWTKERILIYPQIPQIGQERVNWFIHRLYRLDKKENTDLSTDWKRMYLLELPRSKVSGW